LSVINCFAGTLAVLLGLLGLLAVVLRSRRFFGGNIVNNRSVLRGNGYCFISFFGLFFSLKRFDNCFVGVFVEECSEHVSCGALSETV